LYCVQTIQWACSYPIAWGRCYDSKGLSKVLMLLNVWFPLDNHPDFIGYDNACKLLVHIVTQNAHNPWLKATRFNVDAWHYINHCSDDHLCHEGCNPAPLNGSQPDLVILTPDITGHLCASRAFNTKVTEQANTWLDGFESQLQQMTNFDFDFFMHCALAVPRGHDDQD
ncbi:hypothetical protein K439DRAFT_1344851, partial [Ramaria rubella]